MVHGFLVIPDTVPPSGYQLIIRKPRANHIKAQKERSSIHTMIRNGYGLYAATKAHFLGPGSLLMERLLEDEVKNKLK